MSSALPEDARRPPAHRPGSRCCPPIDRRPSCPARPAAGRHGGSGVRRGTPQPRSRSRRGWRWRAMPAGGRGRAGRGLVRGCSCSPHARCGLTSVVRSADRLSTQSTALLGGHDVPTNTGVRRGAFRSLGSPRAHRNLPKVLPAPRSRRRSRRERAGSSLGSLPADSMSCNRRRAASRSNIGRTSDPGPPTRFGPVGAGSTKPRSTSDALIGLAVPQITIRRRPCRRSPSRLNTPYLLAVLVDMLIDGVI
jgi:hypothetical protein